MAVRFYLMPKVATVGGSITTNKPAHLAELGNLWSGMDFGQEPVYLIRADVTPAQHTALTAFSDVIAFPADLTTTLGGAAAVTAAKTKLEALKIPADWVTTTTTTRELLRAVARFIAVNQRLDGLSRKSVFEGAITPETTVAQLTAAQRTALAGALVSFGLDTSAVAGVTTLRQILKTAAASIVDASLDAAI